MNRPWNWFFPTVSMIFFAPISSAHADPSEEKLLPIERKFSTFSIRVTKSGYAHFGANDKIPDGALPAKIIAIDGRDSKDIWMLTETGVVLQDDGATIKFRQAKPCKWGEYNRESNGVGTHLYNITVDANEVNVFGEYRDMNTRIGGEVRATLSRNGKWSCAQKSLVPDHVHSNGALTWRAAYNMDGDACRIGSTAGHCTSGPRFAPTHVDPPRDSIDMGIHNVALWMSSPDDGWVVTLDETFHPALYRYNGVTWAKQKDIDDIHVFSIWGDDQNNLWLTGGTGTNWDSPATMILRYDGKNLNEIPVPSSLTTRMVRGHSARDVWFGGNGDVVYQWDGGRLRQGKLPGEVSDMWISSDGIPFFVLPEAIAFATSSGEKH